MAKNHVLIIYSFVIILQSTTIYILANMFKLHLSIWAGLNHRKLVHGKMTPKIVGIYAAALSNIPPAIFTPRKRSMIKKCRVDHVKVCGLWLLTNVENMSSIIKIEQISQIKMMLYDEWRLMPSTDWYCTKIFCFFALLYPCMCQLAKVCRQKKPRYEMKNIKKDFERSVCQFVTAHRYRVIKPYNPNPKLILELRVYGIILSAFDVKPHDTIHWKINNSVPSWNDEDWSLWG